VSAGVAQPAAEAVLVMSYGTPAKRDEVEAYYTDVRRGRPPSPEQLADLQRRYDAIGGLSPLAERTAEQVAAIGAALDALAPGRYSVWSGTKHGHPRIEEAVDSIAASGAGRLVGLVLAPHYSAMSVGEYVERARRRAEERGLESAFVLDWHDDPALVELLSRRLGHALRGLGVAAGRPDPLGPAGAAGRGSSATPGRTVVLFTAHSLPRRVLESGDPYPDQLAATAALVATACGLDGAGIAWRVGWQSAGRTPEPWIGPDILELLRALRAEGAETVVVCPAGFTADHLEVLYDLDVEAATLAAELGLRFARTASLNDDPGMAELLARRVLATGP
jgi:ferrochelatase